MSEASDRVIAVACDGDAALTSRYSLRNMPPLRVDPDGTLWWQVLRSRAVRQLIVGETP